MAYCAHCGNMISDHAATCPNCGQPTAVAPAVLTYPYAGFWRRAGGLLIDGLLIGAAGFIIGGGRNNLSGTVIGFLYNWLLIAFNDGRTVGKMALGIRIARPDGSGVDLQTAAIRAGMAIVSGLAIGLGYIWAAFDAEKRTWHDMIADTRAFHVGPRVS